MIFITILITCTSSYVVIQQGLQKGCNTKLRQSHHIQSVLPRVNNALAGSLFHLMASIGIYYAIFGGMRPCFQFTCFSSVAEQNREPSTAQKHREIRGYQVAVLRISCTKSRPKRRPKYLLATATSTTTTHDKPTPRDIDPMGVGGHAIVEAEDTLR